MKWGNYIKRTAVRRVIWIVVGVVVYAVSGLVQDALAQSGPPNPCPSGGNDCNVQDAYQACVAVLAWADAGNDSLWVPGSGQCTATNPNASSGSWSPRGRRTNGNPYTVTGGVTWWYSRCPSGQWDDEFKRCNDCSSQGDRTFRVNHSVTTRPGSTCGANSCLYSVASDPNNCRVVTTGHPNRQGFTCWYNATPTGGMCDPDSNEPESPDEDQECPVGSMRASDGTCKPRGDCPLGQFEVDGVCTPDGACPAGHVKGPDGSCNPESCPAGQARGADGTCKADDNDDGTPDEDEEGGDGDNKDGKKFSGGESCDVPPTCSGDAIMCGQARIQWRIDCNTRKNTTVVGGGQCNHSAPPVCTGEMCDHVEQEKMLQLWESQCALQRIADAVEGEGTGGGGDLSGVEDRLDRIGNFLDGDGDCMATEGGCGDGDGDHWIDGDDVEASEWSSGLASTGTCPAPISRTISLGQHVQDIEFSFQPLCDFAALLRWVLITAATILSALLIGGFRSNT